MKRILTALACSCAFAMACNAQMRAARMMAFGGGWKNPYVTDGLIHCLHGKWNLGWNTTGGTSSSTWIDCVTKNSVSINRGTNSYFSEDAWHRNTELGEFFVPMSTWKRGTTTEVVIQATQDSGRILGYKLAPRAEFTLTANRLLVYCKRDSGSPADFTWMNIPTNRPIVLSCAIRVNLDGTIVASTEYPSRLKSPVSVYVLADEFDDVVNVGAWFNTSSAITADYYVIRNYNRVLTDDELSQNWNSDKIVFGF